MRLLVAVIAACFAGGLAFLLVDRPWNPSLSAEEAARALQERLHRHDRFACERLTGLPNSTEPDWDYLCRDVTRPARMAYFVETDDDGIARIEVAG